MNPHIEAFESLLERFTELAEAKKEYDTYRESRGPYDDGYYGQRYYDAYQNAAEKARYALDSYILALITKAMTRTFNN